MSHWGLLRHIAVSQDPWGSELHGMDINVIHVSVCMSLFGFFTSFMNSCAKPSSDGDSTIFKVLLGTLKYQQQLLK